MIDKVAKGWTYHKLVRYSFFSGLICMGAVHSLVQDWFGMEEYVQHCRENWVSGSYTVPIAVVILLIGITYQVAAKTIASRCDKLSERNE